MGRENVLITMFITQAVLHILLPQISSRFLCTLTACDLLACYSGGFATVPASAGESGGEGDSGAGKAIFFPSDLDKRKKAYYGPIRLKWSCFSRKII